MTGKALDAFIDSPNEGMLKPPANGGGTEGNQDAAHKGPTTTREGARQNSEEGFDSPALRKRRDDTPRLSNEVIPLPPVGGWENSEIDVPTKDCLKEGGMSSSKSDETNEF